MLKQKDSLSVLVVSSGSKAAEFLNGVLPDGQYSPVINVSTASEAKRLLVSENFDIVFINTPLSDEFGVQLAIDISNNTESGVMLFVKADSYEQVSYKTEEFGVFTMSRPINRQAVLEAVRMLVASRSRYKILMEKNNTLEQKMKDIRLVNQAKLILMEKEMFSEQEAHKFIEKTAMDKCVKKAAVAQNIIEKYS